MDKKAGEPAAWPLYRSHKLVHAAKIERIWRSESEANTIILLGLRFDVGALVAFTPGDKLFARGEPAEGDYIVRYDDAYVSWSPAMAFEEGYTRLARED